MAETKKLTEKEKDLLAYELARKISEVAKSEEEIKNMIFRIQYQFDNARKKAEITLPDYATDIIGAKVLPQKNPGQTEGMALVAAE